MKRQGKSAGKILDQSLARYSNPAPEEIASAIDRVGRRLEFATNEVPTSHPLPPGEDRVRDLKFLAIGLAAAAIAMVVLIQMPAIHRLVWGIDAHAVVESADGSLSRKSGGTREPVRVGERIEAGDILSSSGGTGNVIVLADGSRIEVRSNSELSLSRADDGVRIRLSRGGVIVSAAKQRTGHLYVQTREVDVSVVGTVFLVNAEEAGSRVAVIQGEVHVQQGGTLKKLQPGEQVASNPLMKSHPVLEEISWSREAEAHMALLQQSVVATPAVRLVFNAASVRPVDTGFPLRVRCRGVDGELVPVTPADAPVPLGRCVGSSVALKTLIAAAYDIDEQRISGIPDVTRQTDFYRIEAVAENTSTVTTEQLRQMLQNLLADRFKLSLHRETKEAQGYVIHVGKDGVKFREAAGDEEPVQIRPAGSQGLPAPGQRQSESATFKGAFRIRRLADSWSRLLGGLPVIDKTGLEGVYDISLTLTIALERIPLPTNAGGPRPVMMTPKVEPRVLASDLEEQLGLRLESQKVPVEYIVVDHVEKPSEN
jgi:uncharacterized protein (TIGR03435 family)